MTDPATVAKGLTKAQQKSVLAFHWNHDRTAMHCPRYRDAGRMRRSLTEAGICSETGRMTKLGLAVRNLLEKEQ